METPIWGSYSDGDLSSYASKIKHWSSAGKDVYCYFDNDSGGECAEGCFKVNFQDKLIFVDPSEALVRQP